LNFGIKHHLITFLGIYSKIGRQVKNFWRGSRAPQNLPLNVYIYNKEIECGVSWGTRNHNMDNHRVGVVRRKLQKNKQQQNSSNQTQQCKKKQQTIGRKVLCFYRPLSTEIFVWRQKKIIKQLHPITFVLFTTQAKDE